LHAPDGLLRRHNRWLRLGVFEDGKAAYAQRQKQHGQKYFFLVHRGDGAGIDAGLSDPLPVKQSLQINSWLTCMLEKIFLFDEIEYLKISPLWLELSMMRERLRQVVV
jgi:hypothetical protein